MNTQQLLKKIRQRAKEDEKNRRDPRFLNTIGFLAAKGLLRTDLPIVRLANKRLRVDDAVWAGLHVEPRILETLPAAVLRLGRHFDLDPVKHKELARTVAQLRAGQVEGAPFLGVPYAKLRIWADLPLSDRRVKPIHEKRVPKTFRLAPQAIQRLQAEAQQRGWNETAVLEGLIMEHLGKP